MSEIWSAQVAREERSGVNIQKRHPIFGEYTCDGESFDSFHTGGVLPESWAARWERNQREAERCIEELARRSLFGRPTKLTIWQRLKRFFSQR